MPKILSLGVPCQSYNWRLDLFGQLFCFGSLVVMPSLSLRLTLVMALRMARGKQCSLAVSHVAVLYKVLRESYIVNGEVKRIYRPWLVAIRWLRMYFPHVQRKFIPKTYFTLGRPSQTLIRITSPSNHTDLKRIRFRRWLKMTPWKIFPIWWLVTQASWYIGTGCICWPKVLGPYAMTNTLLLSCVLTILMPVLMI